MFLCDGDLKLFQRVQGETVLSLFLEVLFLQFAETTEIEGYRFKPAGWLPNHSLHLWFPGY